MNVCACVRVYVHKTGASLNLAYDHCAGFLVIIDRFECKVHAGLVE